MFFAFDDDRRKSVLIGNYHPQGSIGLDNIDPMYAELIEVRCLWLPGSEEKET